MKLGIKIAITNSSIADLDAANPAAAEVWFNIAHAEDYTPLFEALKKRKIDVGLHFWGALPDGTWMNIAYPDSNLINHSLKFMRDTIKIAARYGFSYVNIHPGCQAKVAIDFEHESFRLLSNPVDLHTSESLFIENAIDLSEYAKALNIVFTVETVPLRVTSGWYDIQARLHPMNIYELPVESIISASEHGLWVANDFVHTSANKITDTAIDVWKYLKVTTEKLAPTTRLIHLGFLLPPYNGTDFHDMLDNPLLETDQAVPNKKQMMDLLQIFNNRDDVWIITEPKTDHVKNYFLAKAILTQADVKSS